MAYPPGGTLAKSLELVTWLVNDFGTYQCRAGVLGPQIYDHGPHGTKRNDAMIGLIVVTHGGLARELLKAAEHVCGPQRQAEVVCIEADDDIAKRTNDIKEAVARVDTGAGVILLTDVYGSTPFKAAFDAAEKTGSRVISGVNVPMLIKLACVRKSDDMDAAINDAKTAGQKYICVCGGAAATTAAE